MSDKAKVLTGGIIISDYEFVRMPMGVIQDRVERDLTHSLAKEIMKSNLVTLTEEPDFGSSPYGHMAKRIRAEVVVMDREEYHRLKRIEADAEKAAEKTVDAVNKFVHEVAEILSV